MQTTVPRRLDLPRALALAVVLVGCAYLAVQVRPPGTSIAVIWPAAGVALAALVLVRRSHWPVVAVLVCLGTAAGNALAGRELGPALLFGVANTVEALVTATLFLRWGRGRATITRLEDVWRLLASAAVGALCGGLLAGLNAEFLLGGHFLDALRAFLVSHPAGIALVAPLVLIPRTMGPRRSGAERISQWGLLVLTTLVVFGPSQVLPLSFLPLPALMWCAIRFGTRTAILQMLLITTVAAVATQLGSGPFSLSVHPGVEGGQPLLITVMQAWLLALGLAMTVLGLTVEGYRTQAADLLDNETLFRRTFDEAMLGMVMLEVRQASQAAQGAVITRCNPVAGTLLGEHCEKLPGTDLHDHLETADAQMVRTALQRLVQGQVQSWHGELRLSGLQASRCLAVTMSPLPEHDGTVRRVTLQMTDVTDRHVAEEQLRELALHDPLTGLPNRTLLLDRMQYWLDIHQRDAGRLVLLFCDLDDFKSVNDSAGHGVGDALLVEMAARMTGSIRPQDTVARLGGDEFVVLAPAAPTDPETFSMELSARILKSLTAPVDLSGRRYHLSASIGVTVSVPGSTPDSLLREADTAMYEAKRAGKGRSAVFTEAHHDQATRRVRLKDELHTALDRGELTLFVQPVVDMTSGAVVAGEALVRWRHPVRGLLGPAEWLDVAESCEVIHPLGAWVIDESCRMAGAWLAELGAAAPVVHANVSARQVGRGSLVPDVRGALLRHDLPGSQLVLELTETQLDRAHNAVLTDVMQVRADGVRLAADDFGTGYSSLTRLTDLPVDMIKIDRAFVARMGEDERARAVVSSLVTMGNVMQVDVVAEGVETPEQADLLGAMGCHLVQGFWWSRPVPEDQFLKLVRQSLPRPSTV